MSQKNYEDYKEGVRRARRCDWQLGELLNQKRQSKDFCEGVVIGYLGVIETDPQSLKEADIDNMMNALKQLPEKDQDRLMKELIKITTIYEDKIPPTTLRMIENKKKEIFK